jgi:hypothetical protein
MNTWKAFLFSCAVGALFCPVAPAQIGVKPKNDVTLRNATDDKFRIGDIWEYETRKGEEHSKLTIVKIDNSPELGLIVHIGVDNIRFSNCNGAPEPEAVPHMPFARKALDASVKKRVASGQPLPDFQGGYEEWKTAYSKKHAGVYVVGVSDAVSVAEKTFRTGIGCE